MEGNESDELDHQESKDTYQKNGADCGLIGFNVQDFGFAKSRQVLSSVENGTFSKARLLFLIS